jgi:hypothetical protein
MAAARPVHPWLAAFDALAAALLLGGVWLALPARWWPVDVVGTALALLLTASAVGLGLRAPWGRVVGLVAAGVALAIGLAVVTALALTASYLAGLYGPVGAGGALILAAVAALVLPYLVVLPAAQIIALGRP